MNFKNQLIVLILAMTNVSSLAFAENLKQPDDLSVALSKEIGSMSKKEMISHRLDLLKVKSNIDDQVDEISSKLGEVNCGPYSAQSVAIAGGALYMIAFFKPSNFVRGELSSAIWREKSYTESLIPKKGIGSRNLSKQFKVLNGLLDELSAQEEKIFFRRLAFTAGLAAVPGMMDYFDVTCNDAAQLLRGLVSSSDEIDASLNILEQNKK
jgi:hypothetical protein